ncbi:MAG: hypothetical protein ACYC26_11365 [Phycisphaerales bacterium]
MTTAPTSFPQLPGVPQLPGAFALDEASRQQIRDARVRRRRIDRVCGMAAFNGWSAAILAALSMLFVLFDPLSILAVLVLGIVAFVEFRGRNRVKQLDERGLSMLAANQAAFGAVIILYACRQLISVAGGSDPHLQELAGVGDMGRQIADLEQTLLLLVYASLIPATIIFQGGMAWFYFRSRKVLRAFIVDTPPWVIDLLKAAG